MPSLRPAVPNNMTYKEDTITTKTFIRTALTREAQLRLILDLNSLVKKEISNIRFAGWLEAVEANHNAYGFISVEVPMYWTVSGKTEWIRLTEEDFITV